MDDESERLMLSPESPIVLAPACRPSLLSGSVAPGIRDLGVMLPTTPLHVELFRGAPYDALVMTSGNLSDEPIARDNDEALTRLAGIVDWILLHDRDVVNRLDDSVIRTSPRGPIPIRRARGYVPRPVALPVGANEPILAMGAFLQNTACIGVEREAFLTQHVGDLDAEAARMFFEEVVNRLERFLEVRPATVATDLHPDYAGTWLGERLAKERGGRVIRVQHHLAHAAGTLGENDKFPDGVTTCGAIILDGTGLGPDETIWGGEFLTLYGDLRWQRRAHGNYISLVGGERAVKEPWRVAVAALVHAGKFGILRRTPLAEVMESGRAEQIAKLAECGAWPKSAGAGRVFEAAGAMLGLCAVNGWEGEAAAQCEAAASEATRGARVWSEVALSSDRNELPTIELLVALGNRLSGGENRETAALGFHMTFAALAAELAERVFVRDVSTVALGGGCFVNRILLDRLADSLERRGFEVMTPRQLPPGDGGISYGQVVLATASIERNRTIQFEGEGVCV